MLHIKCVYSMKRNTITTNMCVIVSSVRVCVDASVFNFCYLNDFALLRRRSNMFGFVL